MRYIKKTKSGIIVSRIMGGRSNVFLLSKGGMNLLIDTSPRIFWPLLKFRLGLIGVHKIDVLLLTHAHFDHADNASNVKEELGATVLVQLEDASNLETGLPSVLKGKGRLMGFFVNKLTSGRIPSSLRTVPCSPDILVEEDYDLRKYGFNARVIHTPGHTAGSLSVVVDDELALVGDTLFGWFGVLPPFAANYELLVQSWNRLAETGCTQFFPSHGPVVKREHFLKALSKQAIPV